MENEKHVYHYKLDFLYQSIAVYAATIVLYLLIRGWFVEKEFSIVWRDPILYLLCGITLLSLFALLYNVVLKRRIEIAGDTVRFISAVRTKAIKQAQVESVTIGRESQSRMKGTKVISIRLRDRRRPIRIRPLYFEHGKQLSDDLQGWAGNLLRIVKTPRLPLRTQRG